MSSLKLGASLLYHNDGTLDDLITIKTSFRIEFVFSIELSEEQFFLVNFRTVYGECAFVSSSEPKII